MENGVNGFYDLDMMVEQKPPVLHKHPPASPKNTPHLSSFVVFYRLPDPQHYEPWEYILMMLSL